MHDLNREGLGGWLAVYLIGWVESYDLIYSARPQTFNVPITLMALLISVPWYHPRN